MRMKLIVGIILCVVALLGMIVSAYAWMKTADKKEDLDENTEERISAGNADTTELDERKETLDNEYNDWEQAAKVSAGISVILLLLGQILIIVDVGKIKIPEEEKAKTESKGDEEEEEE